MQNIIFEIVLLIKMLSAGFKTPLNDEIFNLSFQKWKKS